MKIKLDRFSGLQPRVEPKKLGAIQAQTAQNVDLLPGSLTPMKEPGSVATLSSASAISVYPYNSGWLEWDTDVDVAKGPVQDDQYQRIYYTGDEFPKVRGISGGSEFEYGLGVPKPNTKPTVAAVDKGTVTWKRRGSAGTDGTWGYQYEEPDGTISQSGDLNEGAGATDVVEVTAGVQYTVTTIPAKVGASASATFVLWFDAVDENDNALGRLYPSNSKYVNNSDFYLSGAEARGVQTNQGGAPNATFDITYVSDNAVDYEVDRAYATTFVTAEGEEGPPSEPSTITTITPVQNGSLSAIDTAIPAYSAAATYKRGQAVIQAATYYVANQDIDTAEAFDSDHWDSFGTTNPWNIEKVRIYRTNTTDAGTFYFYVAEIDFGTATYTDSTDDVDLGEELTSTYWYPPRSTLTGLVAMPGGFFAAFEGKTVHFSEQNRPHAWNFNNGLTTEFDIVGLGVNSTGLVVVTTGNPEIMTGTAPEFMTQDGLDAQQACVSKRSIAVIGEGPKAVIYASPDGLVMVQGSSATLITKALYDKQTWNDIAPSAMIAAVHDDRYFGFTGTTNIILNPTAQDMALTTTDQEVFGLHQDLETDTLYMIQAGTPRVITSWRTGTNNMTMTWRSAKFQLPRPDSPIIARVLAEGYASSAVTINLYSADNATAVYTKVVDNDEAWRIANRRKEKVWEFEVVSTQEITEILLSGSMSDL